MVDWGERGDSFLVPWRLFADKDEQYTKHQGSFCRLAALNSHVTRNNLLNNELIDFLPNWLSINEVVKRLFAAVQNLRQELF